MGSPVTSSKDNSISKLNPMLPFVAGSSLVALGSGIALAANKLDRYINPPLFLQLQPPSSADAGTKAQWERRKYNYDMIERSRATYCKASVQMLCVSVFLMYLVNKKRNS
jgi:hypothetical protein